MLDIYTWTIFMWRDFLWSAPKRHIWLEISEVIFEKFRNFWPNFFMCLMGAYHVVSYRSAIRIFIEASCPKDFLAYPCPKYSFFLYRNFFYIIFQNLDFWKIWSKFGKEFSKNLKNHFFQILCLMSENTFLSQNRYFL